MREPCSKVPAIQIVGTNGKGSIASFIRTGLSSYGVKTGIITSPHLISWCERIAINEKMLENILDFVLNAKKAKNIKKM